MHVKELVPKVKGLAVKAGGFIRRCKRLTIVVVVATLLFGPLGDDRRRVGRPGRGRPRTRCAAAQAVH